MLDDQALEGLTIHVLEPTQMLRSTSEFVSAVLLKRGDVVQLTAEDIEASKNRLGESTFACIDDPDLQILRWGREVFGIGPWPSGLPVYRDEAEDPAWWNSSQTVNRSQVIANYTGDRGDHDVRRHGGLRPGLRAR